MNLPSRFGAVLRSDGFRRWFEEQQAPPQESAEQAKSSVEAK